MPSVRARAFLFTLFLLHPVDAFAQLGDCEAPEHWIRVRFDGVWDERMRTEVLADLRAELEGGVVICEETGASAPPFLADVQIAAPVEGRVAVQIEISDELTDKRVTRDVDLGNVTERGRDLTIALAVAELLRASWIELAIAPATEPRREVPAPVQTIVRDTVDRASRPPPAPENALGLFAALEYSIAGHTQIGADVAYTRWLVDFFGLRIAAGARAGVPRPAPHGSIDSYAIAAAIDLRFALTPRTDFACIALDVGAAFFWIHFDGHGTTGGSGASAEDVALSVRAAFALDLRLAPSLALEARVGAGVPLLGVLALDEGVAATGFADFEVFAALGPALEF
jgi:hypothetical protein